MVVFVYVVVGIVGVIGAGGSIGIIIGDDDV